MLIVPPLLCSYDRSMIHLIVVLHLTWFAHEGRLQFCICMSCMHFSILNFVCLLLSFLCLSVFLHSNRGHYLQTCFCDHCMRRDYILTYYLSFFSFKLVENHMTLCHQMTQMLLIIYGFFKYRLMLYPYVFILIWLHGIDAYRAMLLSGQCNSIISCE